MSAHQVEAGETALHERVYHPQPEILEGQPRKIILDEQETENARLRIADKLARLRKGDCKSDT